MMSKRGNNNFHGLIMKTIELETHYDMHMTEYYLNYIKKYFYIHESPINMNRLENVIIVL